MQTSRKNSYLLRLPLSLREHATALAHTEQISLNHFISIAVAEKITRMEAQAEKSAAIGTSRLSGLTRASSSTAGTHHVI